MDDRPGLLTLEATGSGGLEIHSDVVNNGVIAANGGNVKVDGAVTGTGSATISGNATLEFAGLVNENIQFTQAATGTLKLDTTATAASHVGNYAITPSGLTSARYAICVNVKKEMPSGSAIRRFPIAAPVSAL